MVTESLYLDQAIRQILNSIRDALLLHTDQGGFLEEVASVTIGERSRMQPPTPVIWIFGSIATCDHRTMANKEKWRLPIEIVSVTKELDDTEKGYLDANEFAAKARTVVINNRNLDLPFVSDVKSVRFLPSQQYMRDNTVYYGAGATIEVSFYAREYSLGG